MMTRLDETTPAAHRSAADLIDAVLRQMQDNLEPLKYSTLAPARYLVYVHPREFARLEGIIPILQDQTRRALSEAVDAANTPGRLAWATRVLGRTRPPIENPAGHWQVDFLPDPDGELPEGAILIESELLLPAVPELAVGERTRRVSTMHLGSHTTTTRSDRPAAGTAAVPRLARLAYVDDGGSHEYDMARDAITIGRGGVAHHVDVKIVSSTDVSREHARIRRDPASGAFFLVDLSSLGTTLNGRHVPRGYDDVEGHRKENGTETPLPDGARIGLADTVFLDFSVSR